MTSHDNARLAAMATALALLAGSAAPAADAAGQAPPKLVSVAEVKDDLRIFHDGAGHYLASPLGVKDSKKYGRHLYYGDGKTFYRQPVVSYFRAKGDRHYSLAIVDPRALTGATSSFTVRKGAAQFHCQDRKTKLTELARDKARAMVAAAKFLDIPWQRRAHALARDDVGTYYYVDRLSGRTVTGGLRGFRVFVGQRGKLRRLRMKNVVSDPRGEVFITNRGRLRLVLDNAAPPDSRLKATWIRRGRSKSLTRLSLSRPRTIAMIYTELGVYTGQPLHRPCDDL